MFDVPNSTKRRLSKRAIKYLAFDDEGLSILVDSEGDASKFILEDGALKSGSQYVAIDSTAQAPRFKLQDDKPEDPVTVEVNASGTVSLPQIDGFCLQGEELVVIEEGAEATANHNNLRGKHDFHHYDYVQQCICEQNDHFPNLD